MKADEATSAELFFCFQSDLHIVFAMTEEQGRGRRTLRRKSGTEVNQI